METMLLQPYSMDMFNTLPDLHTAHESFVSNGGTEVINGLFKPMIEKYALQARLGVGLLHRHFDLEDCEKLVEFNNISFPWKIQNGDDYSGGKILPTAWAVTGDKLLPYEFYFSPLGRDSPFNFEATKPFLSDFMQAIAKLGLEKTICLRLFPHVGFTGALEITEGRANINLSPDQVYMIPSPSRLEMFKRYISRLWMAAGMTPRRQCGFLSRST